MFKIKDLCKIANVSTSGFYRWQKAKINISLKDKKDFKLISQIFHKKQQKAGWRTIKMVLEKEYGLIMNHKKIRRIMFKFGLKTKIRRKSKYRKTFQKLQNICVCSNILNRKFNTKAPKTTFSTDVTYLFYDNKPAYLSVIKDLGSKEIVAYVLSKKNNLTLTLDTLKKSQNLAL